MFSMSIVKKLNNLIDYILLAKHKQTWSFGPSPKSNEQ